MHENNLQFTKFNALEFLKYNPYHEKLAKQNWQETKICLNTPVIGDSEFHRLFIEEKFDWKLKSKNLLFWLLLCYLS